MIFHSHFTTGGKPSEIRDKNLGKHRTGFFLAQSYQEVTESDQFFRDRSPTEEFHESSSVSVNGSSPSVTNSII